MVLATPTPQQSLAAVLLDSGCHVVTTSDDCADVDALLCMERAAQQGGRSLVVGAAASPGLTGLLARMAADELDTLDEFHVTIHGTGGPACARQHHGALGDDESHLVRRCLAGAAGRDRSGAVLVPRSHRSPRLLPRRAARIRCSCAGRSRRVTDHGPPDGDSPGPVDGPAPDVAASAS